MPMPSTAPPPSDDATTPAVSPGRWTRTRLALGGAALLVFGFWLGGRLGPLAVLGSGDPLTGGTWLPTPVPAEAYIGGAVARPGLYPLVPNARLAALLQQAGGPSRDADLARLDPARPVHDGETIAIPHRRHGACARD